MTQENTLVLLTNLTFADLPEKDQDTFNQHIDYLVTGLLTPICCILGIVGNTLAVITWNRPSLRSSTGRFLSAQAVADIGVLLFTMAIMSTEEWVPSLVEDRAYAIFFSHAGLPLYHFFVHCSVWITLAVTIERYIMVCLATKAKSLCGERQTNIAILIITICSIIANVPFSFVYGVASPTHDDDTSSKVIIVTGFGQGLSRKVYGVFIACISLVAVPWCCVLYLNLRIMSKISASNKRMMDKKTSDSALKAKKTEAQITRLLLAVTFTYLSVMGPYCLLQIAVVLHEQGVDPERRRSGITITRFGYVLNSSLNFILYCMMGRRFRRELKTMLGIKLSEEDMSTTYSSSSGKRTGTTDSSVYTSCEKE